MTFYRFNGARPQQAGGRLVRASRWAWSNRFNGARPQQAGGLARFTRDDSDGNMLQWSPPSTGGRTHRVGRHVRGQRAASMEPALNRREDTTRSCSTPPTRPSFNGARPQQAGGQSPPPPLPSHPRLQWSPPSTGGRTGDTVAPYGGGSPASMEPALNRREDTERQFIVLDEVVLQWSPPSTGGRTTMGSGATGATGSSFNGARPQQAGGQPARGRRDRLRPASMEPALNRREDTTPASARTPPNSLQWSPPSTGGRTTSIPQCRTLGRWASMEPALNRREDPAARWRPTSRTCFNGARPQQAGGLGSPVPGWERAIPASMEPALNRREDGATRRPPSSSWPGFNGARPQQAGGP